MEAAESLILEDIVERRAAGVDLTPCEREQLFLIARGAMARTATRTGRRPFVQSTVVVRSPRSKVTATTSPRRSSAAERKSRR